MNSPEYAKSLALWTLFHKVVERHPDADLAPWLDAAGQKQRYALAALSARQPDDPAALRILREASRFPDFFSVMSLHAASATSLGLPDIEVDGGTASLTAYDVAVLVRNADAVELLLAGQGCNPDMVEGFSWDGGTRGSVRWTTTERTLWFLVAGEGMTTRSPVPILAKLVESGSTLGPVELDMPGYSSAGNPAAVAATLDPDSETRRAFVEARARAEHRSVGEGTSAGTGPSPWPTL